MIYALFFQKFLIPRDQIPMPLCSFPWI